MERGDWSGPEGQDVLAHGFLEFDEEDNAGFSLKSIEVRPYVKNDLICLAAGVECLLIATKKYTIVRKRLNPEQNYEVLAIPTNNGDSEVRHMFMDVCGYHCIFVTSRKEVFYLNFQGDAILPLGKLRDFDLTAVAFNTNPERDSTGSILLGTREGAIYKYSLECVKGKALTVAESEPVRVLEVPGKVTIYGLAFETYMCSVKEPRGGSRMGSSTLVMAITNDTCYQFTGSLPFENLFRKYASATEINKHKKSVPRDTLQESELKLFYIVNEKKKYELHSFAWKSEVSVCHNRFRAKEDLKGRVAVKDFMAEGYQRKDMPTTGKPEMPVAIGITEYSIYFLYKDNLTVISKITKEVECSENFRAGEVMTQMVYDVGTKSMWIYSRKGLYRLIITGANRDLWKQQLDSSNFQEALKLCRENKYKHYGFVAGMYAESKFRDGKFVEAAQQYAVSNKPFEEVILKFLLAGENDGLEGSVRRDNDLCRVPDADSGQHTEGQGDEDTAGAAMCLAGGAEA